MRRIKLLILSVSMIVFSGIYLSSLSAQSTISTKNSQSGNTVKAETLAGDIQDIGGTGYDASGITVKVEDAMLYSKIEMRRIAAKTHKSTRDLAAQVFYTNFTSILGASQGTTSEDVKNALNPAYLTSKTKLAPKGAAALSALDSVLAETISDLQ